MARNGFGQDSSRQPNRHRKSAGQSLSSHLHRNPRPTNVRWSASTVSLPDWENPGDLGRNRTGNVPAGSFLPGHKPLRILHSDWNRSVDRRKHHCNAAYLTRMLPRIHPRHSLVRHRKQCRCSRQNSRQMLHSVLGWCEDRHRLLRTGPLRQHTRVGKRLRCIPRVGRMPYPPPVRCRCLMRRNTDGCYSDRYTCRYNEPAAVNNPSGIDCSGKSGRWNKRCCMSHSAKDRSQDRRRHPRTSINPADNPSFDSRRIPISAQVRKM